MDFDAIENETLRRATRSQINSFGQTPSQLLKKPHPKRGPLLPHHFSMFATPKKLEAHSLHITKSPLVFIGVSGKGPLALRKKQMVTVDLDRVCGIHRWQPNAPNIIDKSPFTFECDPILSAKR